MLKKSKIFLIISAIIMPQSHVIAMLYASKMVRRNNKIVVPLNLNLFKNQLRYKNNEFKKDISKNMLIPYSSSTKDFIKKDRFLHAYREMLKNLPIQVNAFQKSTMKQQLTFLHNKFFASNNNHLQASAGAVFFLLMGMFFWMLPELAAVEWGLPVIILYLVTILGITMWIASEENR